MTFNFGEQYGFDLGGKKIDVILRPSIAEAEASIDCFEIWGEEIVLVDVLVEPKK